MASRLPVCTTFAKMPFSRGLVRVRWSSGLSPVLTAQPVRALIDEQIRTRACHLPPLSPVTLWTQMFCEDGDLWQSYAHYNTDSDGTVNCEYCSVCRDASVGGSYLGCEPMGLFWALQPALEGREGLRLRKRDVQTPFIFNLYLSGGHVCPEDRGTRGSELASVSIERWYMAPGVKRIEIREQGLVGTLFLPPGPGPFPAVLNLLGFSAILLEFRSALFASRGYASFSLAYLGHEELPGPPNTINVGKFYFKKAYQYLQNHDQILADRVGFLGISYGGYVALRSATLPGVKPACCVCINGPVGSVVPLVDAEERTGPFNLDQKLVTVDAQGHVFWREVSKPENIPPEFKVEMEKISCPVLFIVGEDDANCSSVESADAIHPLGFRKSESFFKWLCFLLLRKRSQNPIRTIRDLEESLKAAGKGHLCTRLSYPGAGHIIEPPYSPLGRTTALSATPKKLFVAWGGQPAPHAAAQEDSWRNILKFMDTHLRGDRG